MIISLQKAAGMNLRKYSRVYLEEKKNAFQASEMAILRIVSVFA